MSFCNRVVLHSYSKAHESRLTCGTSHVSLPSFFLFLDRLLFSSFLCSLTLIWNTPKRTIRRLHALHALGKTATTGVAKAQSLFTTTTYTLLCTWGGWHASDLREGDVVAHQWRGGVSDRVGIKVRPSSLKLCLQSDPNTFRPCLKGSERNRRISDILRWPYLSSHFSLRREDWCGTTVKETHPCSFVTCEVNWPLTAGASSW